MKKKTYVGDLLAHGLDTLQSLSADVAHLLGNLPVLLALPQLLLLLGSEFLLRNLLEGLLLLFDNVLEEGNLSDLVAVVVDDVSVVVNLKTDAVL